MYNKGMAITVKKDKKGKLEITLTNGHAESIEKIKSDYGIKHEAAVFAFLLSVAEDGAGAALGDIKNEKFYLPSKELKK